MSVTELKNMTASVISSRRKRMRWSLITQHGDMKVSHLALNIYRAEEPVVAAVA